MAELLPAIPSARTRSDAELHLFRRFKEEAPADWLVIHSLGLRGHKRKPWAEADFVVLNSDGVFVVEVKGGAIRRDGRRWFTNDKQLRESPFDQAGGASAALFQDLRVHVPAIREGIVAYAVAFPDVMFDRDGVDIVSELVYDVRDRDRPIRDWLNRVAGYWQERIDGAAPPRRRGMSRELRHKVVDHIAGDFDLRPSLRAQLGEVEHELIRLTDAQANVMAALSSNPRMIVTGGAGTGKTWLAIEEAVRAAQAGKTVLFLCHTKALSGWLRQRLKGHENVRVQHFHGLTSELITAAGLWGRFTAAPEDQRFRVEHPEYALEALCEVPDPPSFDVLIVDEAQDILTVPSVALLDGLVHDGLAAGTWRLFFDPRQDIFSAMDLASVGEAGKAKPTRFRLTLNCRNTAEIAVQTAVISGREVDEALPVSGPEVRYVRFDGAADLRKKTGQVLIEWLKAGLSPSDIVLLSMYRRENTVLAEGLPPGVPAPLADGYEYDASVGRAIRFATVSGFKGLESEAVFLLDVGRLPPEDRASDVYVAMSRAKSLLAVGISADLDEAQAEMFREFGARLRLSDPRAQDVPATA